MGKRDAAPTHSWVIGSHVNKFIVRVFWILLIVVSLVVGTIWAKLEDSCENSYDWSGSVLAYDINLHVGNDPIECR